VLHVHADHDGNLVHVDEQHGSHGTVSATDPVRLAGVAPLGLKAAPVLQSAIPILSAPLRRVAPSRTAFVTVSGRDPPGSLRSRAPPLPLL
jgi:hypothetical protein